MMLFGVELEWADVDRTAPVPPGLGSWSSTDWTIVNSDGHANCPTGEHWDRGGEINTIPVGDLADLRAQVEELAAIFNPTINYRCNLHVHVSHPELSDLDVVKRAFAWTQEHARDAFMIVEPIPRPSPDDYSVGSVMAGAMRRYRRRLVSHQHMLPAARVAEALAAPTFDEFIDAHAPRAEASGRRQWQIAPRPGINFRSLRKHGTIEFRHFPGTATPAEIESAVRWCGQFLSCAMSAVGDPGTLFLRGRPWAFPQFRPYLHALELGYEETKCRHA